MEIKVLTCKKCGLKTKDNKWYESHDCGKERIYSQLQNLNSTMYDINEQLKDISSNLEKINRGGN